MTGKILLIS